MDTRPLRHVAYRRLFVGNAVANFGYQFTAIAVPVQMYAMTRSSLWVGLLGVAALVPLLVFGVWGGAVADAVDRRRLLLASSLLMWCATLGLLAQAVLDLRRPEVLLVLTAVQSVGFAVSSPTRQAIIPRLVPVAELPAANTMNTTFFNVAMVAGPLTAGLLLTQVGAAAVYAVDALAFTVMLWATLRLPALPPIGGSGRAGWRDIREGLAYIATSPVLLLSFAIDIAAMVFAMPRAMFPQVADQRFGAGSVGWLYAAIAIGSVIAGLTSGWIGRVRRQGVALVVAVVGWGLAVAASGLAHRLWLAVTLLAIGGAADLVSAVYRQTILQTYAPDGLQGRMQGVFISVVAGGPRLGDLRAGATAAAFGTTVAWTGGGLVAAVIAVALAVAFPALLRYTVAR
ncbi:MFS transporter [Rhizomonospora bruguierae]|uniref:MFS transporter n=1 Tax=Rhizomonospora bruguierae TaxID=1581705 RepID=UPI001BCB4F7C|nr:MFS transporter [Micromonospora sp. NBRC 107566]